MSSGLLQAMGAKGIQNIHLDIKPEFSYWKRTYKRPAAFAIETLDVNIPGMVWGSERQTQFPRMGDLLTRLYLELKVNPTRLANPANDTVRYTNVPGHAAIVNCQFIAGTTPVDRVDGEWMELLHELSSNGAKNVDELVLRSDNEEQLRNWTNNGNTIDTDGNSIVALTVKLPFWFSDVASQALPTIAMQFQDLSVKLRLMAKNDLLIFSNPANSALHPQHNGEIREASFLGNFVFTDPIERKLFCANPHEYLIKNYQVSDYHVKSAGLARMQAQVVFSHPCLWFCFFIRKASNLRNKDYFNFERTAGRADDTITSATLSFNGAPREKARGPQFFRVIQTEQYFDRTPTRPIYVYSVAKYPLSQAPSGTVNLSRIDILTFELQFPTQDANGVPFEEAALKIFTQNFNVIRISGGSLSVRYAS